MARKNLNEALRETGERMRGHAVNLRRQTQSAIQKQGIGVIIGLIVICAIGFMFLYVDINSIYDYVLIYGIIGLFLFSLLTDLLLMPFGPDIPLIIAFLSPEINDLAAFIAVMAGVILSIPIAYYIGERWGIAGIEGIFGKRNFEKFVSPKNKKYAKIFIFFSTMTPLPYIPYLAGVYKMNWKECFIYLIFPKGLGYGFYWVMTALFGSTILGWFGFM